MKDFEDDDLAGYGSRWAQIADELGGLLSELNSADKGGGVGLGQDDFPIGMRKDQLVETAEEKIATVYSEIDQLAARGIVDPKLQFTKRLILLLEAKVVFNVAQRKRQKQYYERAIKAYEQSFQISEGLRDQRAAPGDLLREDGRSYLELGIMYWKVDNYPEALRYYEKAHLIGDPDPEVRKIASQGITVAKKRLVGRNAITSNDRSMNTGNPGSWMGWLKQLFVGRRAHHCEQPLREADVPTPAQTKAEVPVAPATPTPRPKPQPDTSAPSLIEVVDRSEGTGDLYELLRVRSVAEIEDLCANFPIAALRLDWPSVQRDFRNNKRFEVITVLAQILLRYNDIRSQSPDLGLPASLPAGRLADVLMSRMMPFIRTQVSVDIAHGLRIRLYDFGMVLMQADRDRDALDCLLASRPSTRADHDFWICACRSNVANDTKHADDIAAAISAADAIVSGKVTVPESCIQSARDILAKLKALTPARDVEVGQPLFSSEPTVNSGIRFVRKYTEPGKIGHTNTYEIHTAETADAARQFLMGKKIGQELYYIVVETPEGNWGADVDGLYLERLLPWQTDVASAQVDGFAAQKMPRSEDLKNVAQGNRDNFLHEVMCGVCRYSWLDGLRYQNQTVVQCPKCRTRNRVDSSNFKAIFVSR